jgi:hypothetical protein
MESANAWAAASPWGAFSSFGSTGAGLGLQEGDFDITRIAEVGWGVRCAAEQQQPVFPAEFREHPHPLLGVYDEYEYEYEYEGDADMEGMHFGDPGALFEMEFGEGGIVHVQSNDSEWNREESRVYPCPARKYSSTELQATQILRQ